MATPRSAISATAVLEEVRLEYWLEIQFNVFCLRRKTRKTRPRYDLYFLWDVKPYSINQSIPCCSSAVLLLESCVWCLYCILYRATAHINCCCGNHKTIEHTVGEDNIYVVRGHWYIAANIWSSTVVSCSLVESICCHIQRWLILFLLFGYRIL